MPTEVIERVGLESEAGTMLAMSVGDTYLAYLLTWRFKNKPLIYHHIFANIFEDSERCGESGVHLFIESLSISTQPKLDDYKSVIYPVMAKLKGLTLNEYDKLRLRRSSSSREFQDTFPEYQRLESGV